MKKGLFLLLWCWAAATQAVTLDDLQQRFASQPVVRADFTQQRQIDGMAQPLRSSGRMVIAREKGLWWRQDAPFTMTLLLDDRRMVQQMAGQPAQVVTAANNPQMFQFNHLLRALFQADRRVLEENFRLDFHDGGQGNWRLVLTPKATPLDKLFNTITLTGERFLNTIDLDDKQGDKTHIVLSHQRSEPAVLSDAEQRDFDVH